jgi:rare lipoprotein A
MKHRIRVFLIALLVFGELTSPIIAKTVVGRASFYKTGRLTANGEQFVPLGLTAAHRYLPFGTRILVTNLKNGRSVVVRINDRGPRSQSLVLDLSLGAARVIGLEQLGIGEIKYEEIPVSE